MSYARISAHGSRFQRWRKRERLTLADVSALSGYSESMLCLVESGKRRLSPKGKVLLSRRLRVPVRELFDVEPVNDDEVSTS